MEFFRPLGKRKSRPSRVVQQSNLRPVQLNLTNLVGMYSARTKLKELPADYPKSPRQASPHTPKQRSKITTVGEDCIMGRK